MSEVLNIRPDGALDLLSLVPWYTGSIPGLSLSARRQNAAFTSAGGSSTSQPISPTASG